MSVSYTHLYIRYVPLDALMALSDIVSLHCPLTEQTRALINEQRLALMKPGALLINAARGGVVDTKTLADALESGRLGGAGIDVFDSEPPLAQDHPLLHTPNTPVSYTHLDVYKRQGPAIPAPTERSALPRSELYTAASAWPRGPRRPCRLAGSRQ